MKTLVYTITFHSYWLHQDKEGKSIGVDVSPILENGLPIFGGKAVKGLFREQSIVLENCNALSSSFTSWKNIFGDALNEGSIKFTSARMQEKVEKKHQYLLFKNITTTAIEATSKQAKEHTLRTIKVVVPMTLTGNISLDEITEKTTVDNLIKDLKLMANLIKEAGKDRYKGMGSCVVKVEEL